MSSSPPTRSLGPDVRLTSEALERAARRPETQFRLTPAATDALSSARTALDDADDEFTTGDIDHILELLYNRSEIYPVNDRFRFTDLAEFDRRYDDEA